MDKKQRNKVETSTIVSMMRSFEKMPAVVNNGKVVNTLSETGRLPEQFVDESMYVEERLSPALITNKTNDSLLDTTSNQLHYMTELRNLCVGDLTSIDFKVTFIDNVVPTSSVVSGILEKKERLLTNSTRRIRETDKRVITTKISQSRGAFTQGDVGLYISEFDQYVNTCNLSLPPFAKDKIQHIWLETLRCYIETKKLDRLNDYNVTLKLMNLNRYGSVGWSIVIVAQSKPVTVGEDFNWRILETHVYDYT